MGGRSRRVAAGRRLILKFILSQPAVNRRDFFRRPPRVDHGARKTSRLPAGPMADLAMRKAHLGLRAGSLMVGVVDLPAGGFPALFAARLLADVSNCNNAGASGLYKCSPAFAAGHHHHPARRVAGPRSSARGLALLLCDPLDLRRVGPSLWNRYAAINWAARLCRARPSLLKGVLLLVSRAFCSTALVCVPKT